MTHDDKLILSAWAHGHAGAGGRLAKRAWWILEDHARRSPADLGGTWSSAADARGWILNFHSMGLVGLMDAPRAGRPQAHGRAVSRARSALENLRDSDPGVRQAREKLLASLDRSEQEALWRVLRRNGESVLRRRMGYELPIPVPAGLRDLLAVYLAPGVKLLAFFRDSARHWDELRGVWVGVPKARFANGTEQPERGDLLQALSLDVLSRRAAAGGVSAPQKPSPGQRALEVRLLAQLATVARTYPGAVTLTLLTDLTDGAPLLRILQGMRERQLWSCRTGPAPGFLGNLQVLPYTASWAKATQLVLAAQLPEVSDDLLGDLQDRLTLRRKSVFCWWRAGDVQESEEEQFLPGNDPADEESATQD